MNRGKASSRVWIVGADGKPQAVEVQTGITDGTATEVSGEGVSEGTEVIVGISASAKSGAPGGPRMF